MVDGSMIVLRLRPPHHVHQYMKICTRRTYLLAPFALAATINSSSGTTTTTTTTTTFNSRMLPRNDAFNVDAFVSPHVFVQTKTASSTSPSRYSLLHSSRPMTTTTSMTMTAEDMNCKGGDDGSDDMHHDTVTRTTFTTTSKSLTTPTTANDQTMKHDVTDLLQRLIRIQSVTPHDNGCQDVVAGRLHELAFHCETMTFGPVISGGDDDDHGQVAVTNLWAVLDTDREEADPLKHPPVPRKPLVVFVGHTDVVPPGPVSEWSYPPFAGEVVTVPDRKHHEEEGEHEHVVVDSMNNNSNNKKQDNGDLNKLDLDDLSSRTTFVYGRGAVDMKGGLACFVVALESFLASYNQQSLTHHDSPLPYRIGVLLTSDEEGDAVFGTRMVLQELTSRGEQIDMCIVGEPSSLYRVGDVIKVGRRGSLSGDLTLVGVQGHVAYPHLARNPIHESLGALKYLVDERWDDGTADFPPTSFQISNIEAGSSSARNVIPGFKKVQFNFRYSPASTDDELKQRVESILNRHSLEYRLEWSETSYPYETTGGELLVETMAAIQDVVAGTTIDDGANDGDIDDRMCGPARPPQPPSSPSPSSSVRQYTRPCTSGGTSDGRFVARAYPHCQIVELGLINSTIHKVDERTSVYDLQLLTLMYRRVLERLADSALRRTAQVKQNNNDRHHLHLHPQPPTYHGHVDIDALPL